MTSKTASVELTKKFIKGLQNYNLSYEDIKKNNWVYCGGNKPGSRLRYFKLFFGHTDTPQTMKVNVYVVILLKKIVI
jgi:hypothetical protein